MVELALENKAPAYNISITPSELQNYREESCLILLNCIRMNRYDNKFIENIVKKYINKFKPLSANQSKVFELITHKYRKQLKTLKIDYKDMLAQDWANGIFDIADLQKQTFFTIVDDEMRLKFNFNKEMIEEVRTIKFDDDKLHINRHHTELNSTKYQYDWTWFPTKNYWAGHMNVYLFKELYKFVIKHNINIDKSVTTLIDQLNVYGTKEDWTPSIHCSNNRFYINCISGSMLSVLDTLDLNDHTLRNFEKIYKELGILPDWIDNENIKKLISLTPRCAVKYDTNTKESQEDLLSYLKTTNSKVFFYVLGKQHISPFMRLGMNSSTDKNKFLKEHGMADWNIDKTIITYGDPDDLFNALDKNNYDTIISPLSLGEILQNHIDIGKFALSLDKYIRIT